MSILDKFDVTEDGITTVYKPKHNCDVRRVVVVTHLLKCDSFLVEFNDKSILTFKMVEFEGVMNDIYEKSIHYYLKKFEETFGRKLIKVSFLDNEPAYFFDDGEPYNIRGIKATLETADKNQI